MNNKRNANVEIARIIGCLIVIGVHVFYSLILPGIGERGNAFLKCIFSDGVAVFWIISGMYMFRNDYKTTMKKALKRIAVPLFICTVVCFYFGRFFMYNCSMIESVTHSKQEYYNILIGAMSFRNVVDGISQTWYLWIYLFVMIFLYPFLKSFTDYAGNNKKVWKYFCLLSIVLILLNDFSLNSFLQISHSGIVGASYASIYMLWGYVLNEHKMILFKRRNVYIYSVLYIMANSIRAFLLLNNSDNVSIGNILYWFTIFGLISGICVIGFFSSLKEITGLGAEIVRFISRQTFNIYMLHWVVLVWIKKHGWIESIYLMLNNDMMAEKWTSIVYLVCVIGIVFLVSMLISVMINMVIKGVSMMFEKFLRMWYNLS